jgi:hypothetical protein
MHPPASPPLPCSPKPTQVNPLKCMLRSRTTQNSPRCLRMSRPTVPQHCSGACLPLASAKLRACACPAAGFTLLLLLLLPSPPRAQNFQNRYWDDADLMAKISAKLRGMQVGGEDNTTQAAATAPGRGKVRCAHCAAQWGLSQSLLLNGGSVSHSVLPSLPRVHTPMP